MARLNEAGEYTLIECEPPKRSKLEEVLPCLFEDIDEAIVYWRAMRKLGYDTRAMQLRVLKAGEGHTVMPELPPETEPMFKE